MLMTLYLHKQEKFHGQMFIWHHNSSACENLIPNFLELPKSNVQLFHVSQEIVPLLFYIQFWQNFCFDNIVSNSMNH